MRNIAFHFRRRNLSGILAPPDKDRSRAASTGWRFSQPWKIPCVLALTLSISSATALPTASAARRLAPATSADSVLQEAQSDPVTLMQKISRNELANSYGQRSPMRYQLRKITSKSDTTKEIVETREGGVARLIAIHGRPLSPIQNQQEIRRLQTLDANPAMQQHRQRNETRDAKRVNEIIRLLPEAFLYRAEGIIQTDAGTFIRLAFEPNPKFSPPDLTARITTGIRGEVWIESQDLRIVRIDGRIFKNVEYGWGLVANVAPGGKLLLKQEKTDSCGWQMARLQLNMRGKAFLLKSLHIVIDETATDYHPVPSSWTYHDAVHFLLRMP